MALQRISWSPLLIMTLVVLAISLRTAAGAPTDDTRKDAKALQGTWGLALDRDQQITREPEIQVVVAGDKITVRSGEATGTKATFTLDPTSQPKRIDLSFTDGAQKGTTYKGIYELDGSSLKVCYGRRRPAAFANTNGAWLWLLQRQPAAKKPEKSSYEASLVLLRRQGPQRMAAWGLLAVAAGQERTHVPAAEAALR